MSEQEQVPELEETESVEAAVDTESVEAETADAPVAAENAPDESTVSPLEEFKAKLRRQIGDWYVVHTYSGYENKVKTGIETRIQNLEAEDEFSRFRFRWRPSSNTRTRSRRLFAVCVFPVMCWCVWI